MPWSTGHRRHVPNLHHLQSAASVRVEGGRGPLSSPQQQQGSCQMKRDSRWTPLLWPQTFSRKMSECLVCRMVRRDNRPGARFKCCIKAPPNGPEMAATPACMTSAYTEPCRCLRIPLSRVRPIRNPGGVAKEPRLGGQEASTTLWAAIGSACPQTPYLFYRQTWRRKTMPVSGYGDAGVPPPPRWA